MTQIAAVLTGDIIRSTQYSLEERKIIRGSIHHISNVLRSDSASAALVPAPIRIFSGDSWQVLVTAPAKSLWVGLLLRTLLRSNSQLPGVDTRFSIGIGEVVTTPGGISSGDGEAFILSGRGLALPNRQKKENMTLNLSPHLDIPPGAEVLQAILGLSDALVLGWTNKQAQAVSGALRGWKSDEIAACWPERPISRRMANDHLSKANWDALQAGLKAYEAGILDLLKRSSTVNN
jgi:hypothetical protein